jgi:hypothetical protein
MCHCQAHKARAHGGTPPSPFPPPPPSKDLARTLCCILCAIQLLVPSKGLQNTLHIYVSTLTLQVLNLVQIHSQISYYNYEKTEKWKHNEI